MALVRQPKTAVFWPEIEVRIYCMPVLKVLSGVATTRGRKLKHHFMGVTVMQAPTVCSTDETTDIKTALFRYCSGSFLLMHFCKKAENFGKCREMQICLILMSALLLKNMQVFL